VRVHRNHHGYCYDALAQYIERASHTRKRFFTLGELKLVCKLKHVSYSARAVDKLVRQSVLERLGPQIGLEGVYRRVH
jgi:hypothetical protein